MSIHEPTPGGIAEVREHKLGRAEPSSGRGRKPHTIISKTYDVLLTIAVNVRQQTRMSIHEPTPGGIAEVREHKLGKAEPSSGGGRKPHTIISETYDVLLTVAVNVGEHAWIVAIPVVPARELLSPRLRCKKRLVRHFRDKDSSS